MKRLRAIAIHCIFWGWNGIFLLIVLAGIMPAGGAVIPRAIAAGAIPYSLLLSFLGIVAVPPICTGIGFAKFRTQPDRLGRLFYGVEAPFFLLCLLRLFLVRELPAGAAFALGTIVVAIVVYLLNLIQGKVSQKGEKKTHLDSPLKDWLNLSGQTAVFWVGIYGTVVLAFYVLPAVWVTAIGFFSFGWVEPLLELVSEGFTYLLSSGIWILLSLILFGMSATLFFGMPLALCWLYVRDGRRSLQWFSKQYGQGIAIAAVTATTAIGALACLLLQQQPSAKAFELLATSPQTDQARQELLAEADTIQVGLRNAYLSPYRYLSSREDNNHIYAMYRQVFRLPDGVCLGLQRFYNQLMAPFLYDGARSDVRKAESLYSEFFDTSIQKGERGAIQFALDSTFNRQEAQAGLINIDQTLVWLKQQEISINEHQDWADIEIHETYQNQTFQDQEIFYTFSLPESATLTGLWLGNSPSRADRYQFRVSPRGAAQQVYNNEVRRQVDPALLEQVGPRQYRLRAFPIPSKQLNDDHQSELHLWMTYSVLQQPQGWPLPKAIEYRNVYWNGKTERLRNGEKIPSQDSWLEQILPATADYQPKEHRVKLLDDYELQATPFEGDLQPDEAIEPKLHLAILLDRSFSMEANKAEVIELFNWLKERGFSDREPSKNDADLYLSRQGFEAKRIDDLQQFDAASIVNYGSIQPQEMLNAFLQQQEGRTYDAVVLVTDAGSYELANDLSLDSEVSVPLWLMHVGGQLPASYDDVMLDAIQQSHGGVSTDMAQIIDTLTVRSQQPTAIGVIDGYLWERAGTELSDEVLDGGSGFAAIAARQLIADLSREGSSELEQLDRLHAIATSYKVVSPYSSMIVLVNERQLEDLDEAENAEDRFDREVESGIEELGEPFDPLTVSGVPEPEEWMLLGLVVMGMALLGWRRWRNNRKTPA